MKNAERRGDLPVIGITMGDPVGIGPEVAIRALADGSLQDICVPVLLGDPGVIRTALTITGVSLTLHAVTNIDLLPQLHPINILHVMPLSRLDPASLTWGCPSAETGQAMVDYILEGIRLAQAGAIDAIVTGPINKAAMSLAGYSYPGHTELFAEKTSTKDFAMMLAGERLKVVLVTIHQSVRSVPALLTCESIAAKIRLTARTLQMYFGKPEPIIAVAALNPHAGEEGMFGDEEEKIIRPAVEQCEREGIAVEGPLPADSLFYAAVNGRYDAVVCMYHDQGLIPLKMLHFDDAVNVTLGLPIIRTSVDHGTAYDIAGTGTARALSMINAIRLAVQMAQNNRESVVAEEKKV